MEQYDLVVYEEQTEKYPNHVGSFYGYGINEETGTEQLLGEFVEDYDEDKDISRHDALLNIIHNSIKAGKVRIEFKLIEDIW